MILDAKRTPLDIFELPADAPPAYDDIGPRSPNQAVPSSSSAPPPPPRRPRHPNQRETRSFPPPASNGIGNASHLTPPKPHLPHKSFSAGTPAPRRDKIASAALSPNVQNDVRETVRGLVRDVVQGSSPVRSNASDAIAVLESCAAACSSHSLSLARILQEKSIESHAPIYWAIVSRPLSDGGPSKVDHREDDAFLVALLSRAALLRPIAVSELRSACLVASNNTLFQRLRSIPGVIPLSGTDRVLLVGSSTSAQGLAGSSEPRKRQVGGKGTREVSLVFGDVAKVREGGAESETEWFSVGLQLKMFQRRMRVTGELAIEFIARGRLWQLTFFVVPPLPSKLLSSKSTPDSTPSTSSGIPRAAIDAAHAHSLLPGSWALSLALLEGSAQCYAEARLVVSKPEPEPDVQREIPSLPGRSRTAMNVPSATSDPQSFVHPRRSSEPSKFSFLHRRTQSENRNKVTPKPPIVIFLTSPKPSPLLSLPLSLSTISSQAFPGEVDLSLTSKKKRRPTREEKRAAKKERRAQRGKETRRDRKDRAKVAEGVLVAGLEEIPSSLKNGKRDGKSSRGAKDKRNGKEETAKGGELMYDGCPYIGPDGTLNAVLEARLSTSPPETKDSDCVIC